MEYKIVKIGNSVLRKKTSSITKKRLVSKKFQIFLKLMVTQMRKAGGVGLAANQLGFNNCALVMECRGNKRYPRVKSFPLQTYVNARIVKYSRPMEKGWEGCLSIPGFRGIVLRSQWVTFEAQTPEGQIVRKTVRGFEARVIQHEVDHLNGFFYMDRMKGLKTWTHLEEFNKHFGSGIRDNN
jgi:peptide deformylase